MPTRRWTAPRSWRKADSKPAWRSIPPKKTGTSRGRRSGTAELQVYTVSPGGSDFVMAQTQLGQAHASLGTAISRLGYATISAPRAGVLIARNVEQGMVVQPGVALLALAPDGETQLLLQVDERNLGKLALGQKALASADAYPNQRFDAVVSYINPGIDITRASLEAKLTVADPPGYLRQDMTVSVDIEVARREATLILPGRSVHDTLSGSPWVMGVRGGRAYRQPVHVGLQGGNDVEILDGADRERSDRAVRLRGPHRPADQAHGAVKRWLPFEWIAAVRFLREGRMQTLFIISGIAIGVGVIVFMSALLTGLQANFIKRVLTSQPQIQLIPPDQVARPLRAAPGVFESATVQRPSQRVISIDQWPKIRDRMAAMQEVTAVSPTMAGSALAVRGAASRAITVSGIEPGSYFRIVRVPDYIVAGTSTLSSEDIIVGTELAKDLGAAVGDKLNVQAASGSTVALKITGIVDLGNKGANARTTYVALRTAQSLLGIIGGVTTIDLTVRDIYAAEVIAQRIQASNAVEADSWISTNAQFFTAVRAQTSSNTMIRVFVALSVAFGIAAVLVVSVIQRSKDIGILRAMGTSRGQVLRVFLIQGALLGFVGSIVGSALGVAGLLYWHSSVKQADGSELFPVILDRSMFVATVILATLTGLLAAMAPAVRAAKLDPVVAIRG